MRLVLISILILLFLILFSRNIEPFVSIIDVSYNLDASYNFNPFSLDASYNIYASRLNTDVPKTNYLTKLIYDAFTDKPDSLDHIIMDMSYNMARVKQMNTFI